MSGSNFNSTVESLFHGMAGFLSSKTIVGEPIKAGDTLILPLMEVSFGMAAGAFHREHKESASGGMGGKMTPTAVLVIKDGTVRVITVNSNDPVSKIIDLAPDIINKISGHFSSDPDVDDSINKMKEDAKNE